MKELFDEADDDLSKDLNLSEYKAWKVIL